MQNKVYITECSLKDIALQIETTDGDQPAGVMLDVTIKESNFQFAEGNRLISGGLTIDSVGYLTLAIASCNISNSDRGISIVTQEYDDPKPNSVYAIIEDTSFKDTKYPVAVFGVSLSSDVVLFIIQCDFLQTTVAIAISGYGINVQLAIQDSSIGFASGSAVYVNSIKKMAAEVIIQGTTISNCSVGLELDQFEDSNSSLTIQIKDSEIINSSCGLNIINQGEIGQTDISIINCKISSCEIALQLQDVADGSLRGDVQDSELVNSSYGISFVNRGESWQTIIISIISNSRESGIEFPKRNVQNQSAKEGGNLRMKVLDSMIVKNRGRGLYINVPANTTIEVIIENSVIANTSGISLEAYGDSDFNSQKNLILDLRNVSFVNNCDTSSTKLTTIKVAGISNKVLVHDCLFQGNLGTPIKMILGELYISGITKFSNNEGLQGGALSLIFSKVYFANNTEVVLENNIARDTGGAIYVQYVEQFDSCFYQLPYLSGDHGIDTQLTFTNNKAGTGGDDLYGAVLRSDCSITADVEGLTVTSNSVYDKIFHFTNSSRSSLSPASMRVSLCSPDNEPVCDSLLRYILALILLFYLCYLISHCVKWKRNHHSKGQPVLRLHQHKSDLRNDDYGGHCCII